MTEQKDLNTLHDHITWETWKKRWVDAQDTWQCKGLLHFGFGTAQDRGEVAECVTLYLDLAEGHESSASANPPEKWRAGDIKQKAYNMLCRHFFDASHRAMDPLFLPPEVLEKTLHFFRPSGNGGFVNFRAYNKGENDEIALRFIVNLCRQIWRLRPGNGSASNDTLDAAIAKRPHVLPILHACGPGELFQLIEAEWRGRPKWELFDKRSIHMLEKMANRDRMGVAAVVAGSVPAYLLTLVEIAQAELAKQASQTAALLLFL